MKIIVPMRDDETLRYDTKGIETTIIKNSDCIHPYGHIFYAELGKLFTFIETERFYECLKTNETIAFMQNRRYFTNFNSLDVKDDEVIMAKSLYFKVSLERQFKWGHSNATYLFDQVMQAINAPEDLLNSPLCCFHNIFIMKANNVKKYCEYVKPILNNIFREEYKEKFGAYLAERIFWMWCKINLNIIQEDFTELSKLY